MVDFLNSIFGLLYGLIGIPIFLIFVIIVIFSVMRSRKKRKMKSEDWHGHSPVEKIEKSKKDK
ncbi:hypothetical protein [Niallia nealsonii]|uniref:Uncharacterized protein n=1 Tax=Niallia nealsonii TaxID=115979 RepID=A0A2N0Z6G1_9BACI|nr:hypothetical protein [Niallia nealsonii]PKG25105.1 hypothetical protein CWS01_03130 [Niallia nealsonii]